MAITITAGAPTIVEAGNAYRFTEQFTDFPNTAWSAQYVLQISGTAAKTINATNSNSAFLFTLNSATTSNWAAGHYDFAIYCTEMATSQRVTAKEGILPVLPDLTVTQPQTSAEEMLALVETAITNLTTGGFTSVTVNNISYTKSDLVSASSGGGTSGLLALRTRLQAEVIREHQAQDAFRGIDNSGIIGTRFK